MNKEIILITGANGMVARSLSLILSERYTIRFLTRKKRNDNEFEWNVENNYIDVEALRDVSHVVHLAGTNIAEKRWSSARKAEIKRSRIDTARLLLESFEKAGQRIKTFVSASAVGFYGSATTRNIYTEDAVSSDDFLGNITSEWEAAAGAFSEKEIAKRVVKIRTGIVLSASGGLVERLKPLIQCGLGASLGNGQQYMPWIHLTDLCELYRYAIENESIIGGINAVAPQHVTHRDFVRLMAKTLRRPLWLPAVPSFILKLIFGERSVIFLEGSRVSSQKIIDSGFVFRYLDLDSALEECLK